MTPPELATAMNSLTPEQVAQAMEQLPTDVLEWAVQFESLSRPNSGVLPDYPRDEARKA